VLVVGASLIVSLTVTLLTPPVPRAHLAAFRERVAPPGRWGPVSAAPGAPVSAAAAGSPAGRRPFAVLAGWVLGTGALFLCILLPGSLLHGASVPLVLAALLSSAVALALVCRITESRHQGPDRQ
jgi:hypothetical protein